MSKAATVQSPAQLRNLFVLLLITCGPSSPEQLWGTHKEHLTEDILRQARRRNPEMTLDYMPDMFNETLILLEDRALAKAGEDLSQLGLPSPTRNLDDRLSREMLRETSYDVSALSQYVLANEPILVVDQRAAYNVILDRIERKAGGLLLIAVAVPSSEIAAVLLQGGRTAHSTLRLPLNLSHCEAPLCSITKGTGEAKVLQEYGLIVRDECTTAHRQALEALDRRFQDLRRNGKRMSEVVVLLACDFRQTLPVIPKGTMTDELKPCLKSSGL